MTSKLAKDRKYFGEGNSRGRRFECDFDYCLSCDYRSLNGQKVFIRGILDHEFERFVAYARNGSFVSSEETMVQHSDFEALERLISNVIAFGKLREGQK